MLYYNITKSDFKAQGPSVFIALKQCPDRASFLTISGE